MIFTRRFGRMAVVQATWISSFALATSLATSEVAQAENGAANLAKAAQNPIAAMISVPFQNNTNFNVGPDDKTQNILNIQPVIPVDLSPEWNLVTRTIMAHWERSCNLRTF